jgi:hypothetical protein
MEAMFRAQENQSSFARHTHTLVVRVFMGTDDVEPRGAEWSDDFRLEPPGLNQWRAVPRDRLQSTADRGISRAWSTLGGRIRPNPSDATTPDSSLSRRLC